MLIVNASTGGGARLLAAARVSRRSSKARARSPFTELLHNAAGGAARAAPYTPTRRRVHQRADRPSPLRTKRSVVSNLHARCWRRGVGVRLDLWTVFLSTAGAFHLQAGAFDPLASSMVALLGREFEYEWVAVRCQFILGMLMLVAAQAIRVRYALWSVPNLANAAATFLLFTGAEMLAFFNNKLAGGNAPLLQAPAASETKNMGDRSSAAGSSCSSRSSAAPTATC